MKTCKNATRRNLWVFLSFALVCALAVFTFTGIHHNPTAIAETTTAASEPTQDTSPAMYVAEKNANSVVGVITNTQSWSSETGVTDTSVAQGSGVVIREGGYIVTNCHVIEDGTAYQILMPNGDKVDATLVGVDSSMDLAVLKVDDEAASQLVPVTLGSTSELAVGSTAIAIGNPGGEVLANTVTQGVISALERDSISASNASRSISYIQHDAAINSGNSGGGLFNYKGELIGINTLKYSGSVYSTTSYEGLGFAIPVETVSEIANDLIEYGKVQRPGLGVSVKNQEGPEEPLANNAPESVCIYSVNEGGAADKAGLQQYDFIVAVDGQDVSNVRELTKILDSHEAGDTVEVTVIRYNQAGVYQQRSNSAMSGLYGFGYGYGYGYGYGNNGSDSSNSSSSGELMVSGGYQEITVQVTLEILD